MPKIATPIITNADDSPAYWQIGILWQMMATGVQTDNAFCLLDQVIHGAGGGPTTHTHTQDEGLYIISGKATFNAGGVAGLQGTPGTFVAIPGDCEHSFTVDEPDTHVLNFYLPAGFDQVLVGIAHPAKERKPQPHETIKDRLPPRELADRLGDQYGITNLYGVNPFCDFPVPENMITKATPGAKFHPFIANAATLPHYTTSTGVYTILASSESTGAYSLFEVVFGSGLVVASRTYKSGSSDEMFYILSGSLEFTFDDQESKKVVKGGFVYIPSGTRYSVSSDAGAKVLNWHAGGGYEELIKLEGIEGTGEKVIADRSSGDAGKTVDAAHRSRVLEKLGLIEAGA